MNNGPPQPHHDVNKLYRAIMLAPTLPVCEALLRGETVPLSKLDPAWIVRLGVRT